MDHPLLLAVFVAIASLSCVDDISHAQSQPAAAARFSVHKTEAEWKKQLSPLQYHVLREAGTERPFTGKYWNEHRKGVYRCAACGQPLYASDDKFESGTGWPSYTRPVDKNAIVIRRDTSLGMVRQELLCSRCGGHLGHVFDDGPPPTGKRHCINSASLLFEPTTRATLEPNPKSVPPATHASTQKNAPLTQASRRAPPGPDAAKRRGAKARAKQP